MNTLSVNPSVEANPPGLVELPDHLPAAMDQHLGYVGQERFVYFYYEPRGEEVIWNDGRSYGFGCGGWRAFCDQIAPLAKRYGVGLGNTGLAHTHVLLIDRERRVAYLSRQAEAEEYVFGQHAGSGTAKLA